MLVYAEDTKKVYVLKGSEGFVEVGSDLIADAELSDTTYEFKSATVTSTSIDAEGKETTIESPATSGAYFTVTEEGGDPQTVYVNADIAGAAAKALEAAKAYADSLPHENTTYTFADGTELGQFTVTPSNGTAQTVTVGGLDTAASKSADYFVKSEGYVAYSESEKTKLAGIEAGAEVNIIETVKVNGAALIPDADRAVDVLIPVQGVKSGEKVLALDSADGMLSTTISMEYKSTSEGGDGYIYLKGIGGAELGKIDAAEFVKDGMIDSVVMGENNVLTITWNTASGKT